MNIGIIGLGNIGKLFSKIFLENGYNVNIYDKNSEKYDKCYYKGKNIKFFRRLNSLINKSDLIMISVDKKGLREIFNKLLKNSDKLKGKLIFDTSTFKKDVIKYYYKFPESILVSSMHPMFGSGIRNIKKHKIIITPIPNREKGSQILSSLLSSIGFNVIESYYETHDKAISLTIGISYIIGLSLSELISNENFNKLEIFSGTTFKYLGNHYKSILLDVPELAEYIVRQEYVKEYAKEYVKIINRLRKNPKYILNNLIDFKKKIGEEDIKKSYVNLYDCIESSL
ncbi:MAG: NAD(P)-binding domain-containing protein [Caldisphaera sp.]